MDRNNRHSPTRGDRIQKLSIRHEAIMEYLIANPTASMGECARHFGVTPPWLSSIVHSNAFQVRYRELIQEHVDTRVFPIRDQLTGVAARAIEKLGIAVEASADPDFVLGVVDKTLHRLGYAPSAQAKGTSINTTNNTQINVLSSVSKEDLERARAKRAALYEGNVHDAEADIQATEALPQSI